MKSTLNSKAVLKIDSGLDLTSGLSFADLFHKLWWFCHTDCTFINTIYIQCQLCVRPLPDKEDGKKKMTWSLLERSIYVQ